MNTNKDTCAYCNREEVTQGVCPAKDDDAAWTLLAKEHDDDCEWILTRAHRIEVQEIMVAK